jgi:hypothetical protein
MEGGPCVSACNLRTKEIARRRTKVERNALSTRKQNSNIAKGWPKESQLMPRSHLLTIIPFYLFGLSSSHFPIYLVTNKDIRQITTA